MPVMQTATPYTASSLHPPPRAFQWTPPLQGRWTYQDYKRLPDNGMRYEVIEGELYMTPAPSTKHQRILLALVIRLSDYLKRHPLGELFFAPVDVRMGNLANPVQPDLLFIARDRLNIVKEDYIDGAPDLIAEALSPGSQSYDRRTKFNLYARAGVKEYWLIDPQSCVVEIYVLRGQAYAPLGDFNSDQLLRSEILPNLNLSAKELC